MASGEELERRKVQSGRRYRPEKVKEQVAALTWKRDSVGEKGMLRGSSRERMRAIRRGRKRRSVREVNPLAERGRRNGEPAPAGVTASANFGEVQGARKKKRGGAKVRPLLGGGGNRGGSTACEEAAAFGKPWRTPRRRWNDDRWWRLEVAAADKRRRSPGPGRQPLSGVNGQLAMAKGRIGEGAAGPTEQTPWPTACGSWKPSASGSRRRGQTSP